MSAPAASPADAFAESNESADTTSANNGDLDTAQSCATPPGIMILGRDEFQAQTRSALAELAAIPTGAALLERIAATGKVCVITESLMGNKCGYKNVADATVRPDGTPGPGSVTSVLFNPTLEKLGKEAWQTRPPAIGLGHELIHAMHGAEGTREDTATIAQNGTKADPNDSTRPQFVKKEELATVGIPPHDKDPVTENALRREWPTPQPQRDVY